jgi:hypothetical protein
VIEKLSHLLASVVTPELLAGTIVVVLSFGVRRVFRKP